MDFAAKINLDEEAYRNLVRELKEKTGVVLEGYRRGVAQRRIWRRLRKSGCKTLPEYLDYIRDNPSEAEELARFVTLPVGRFFRNREVFEMLESEVLPAIFATASEGEKLAAWSVGSGEGEEAYSLAMILMDGFATEMRRNEFRITGTDVNSAAVEKARAALYEDSRLREIPDGIRNRYFKKVENCWRVRDNVRNLVKFRRESVHHGKGVGHCDLILMRNLLIYYDRNHQMELLAKVNLCLKPGGFLLLGRSETLLARFRDFMDVVSTRNRIYRKVS